MTTTEESRAIITSMAEFSAWIMFICAISQPRRTSDSSASSGTSVGGEAQLFVELDLGVELFALAAQVLGKFLVHVLEHQQPVEARALVQRTVGHGLLPRGLHLGVELGVQLLVLLVAPLAARDEVLLEALDGIAQRPVVVVVLRAITSGIVAGGM